MNSSCGSTSGTKSPKEKILIRPDLYGPPPQGGLQNVGANAVVLFNNVKRLKLDVAQDPWRRGRRRRVAAAEGDSDLIEQVRAKRHRAFP
jgi:hypothetical protein